MSSAVADTTSTSRPRAERRGEILGETPATERSRRVSVRESVDINIIVNISITIL